MVARIVKKKVWFHPILYISTDHSLKRITFRQISVNPRHPQMDQRGLDGRGDGMYLCPVSDYALPEYNPKLI